jgi:hypothetical protein
MTDKKEVVGEVLLRNVRLSFASLHEPSEMESDDGTTRRFFKANFLIPKEGDEFKNVAKIKKAADEAKAKKWGSNPKDWPKLKPEKICLRDGDLENWDGYAGMLYVSANSSVDRRPQVITNRKDKDGNWIKAEPGHERNPYSGCYVNALIRLWCQDNKNGKRVNASLEVVQFLRDGDAFGAAPVNPNERFTDDMVGDDADLGDSGDDGDDESLI